MFNAMRSALLAALAAVALLSGPSAVSAAHNRYWNNYWNWHNTRFRPYYRHRYVPYQTYRYPYSYGYGYRYGNPYGYYRPFYGGGSVRVGPLGVYWY